MWWLSLNAIQIFTILVGFSTMPHYTVTFGIIFEFVVLGIVPGTDLKIDFVTALTIWLAILLLVLASRTKITSGSFKLATGQ